MVRSQNDVTVVTQRVYTQYRGRAYAKIVFLLMKIWIFEWIWNFEKLKHRVKNSKVNDSSNVSRVEWSSTDSIYTLDPATPWVYQNKNHYMYFLHFFLHFYSKFYLKSANDANLKNIEAF